MRLTLLAAVTLLCSVGVAQEAQQPRIVRPISNASVVRLEGTVHPRIRSATDRGPVSPTMRLERMRLVFSPTEQQRAALDQLLAEQQDRNSPNYHKWLTPEEFADRFGLSQQDIDLTSAWLTSQGFTVEEVARGRDWIAFSGIAAQVEAAFHTSIHAYLIDGRLHHAPSADASIPDAFAGIVSGIGGLHDFAPRPLNVRPRPHLTSSITGNHFLAPGDFATIYNLPSYSKGAVCSSPCNDGTGQSIAIVGQSDLSTDGNPGRNGNPGVNGQQYDLVTFRDLAGLPPVKLTIKVFGTDPGVVSSDVDEANLDVEWTGATAPNANLIFVIEDSSHGGAFQALVDAVNNNLAPVISVSYGVCEKQLSASDQTSLINAGKQANSQGQAIVVASGDSGAADCDANAPATQGLAVDFPGSMPYSTSIGGATFSGDSANNVDPTQPTQYWSGSTNDVAPSAFSYIPETAWNDSSGATSGPLAATGGGSSTLFSKPSWQAGPGVPADGQRDVPDLSFNASPSHVAYLICSQSSCLNGYRASDTSFNVIGGTSTGTPSFAGILALLNQRLGAPQGSPNPLLYSTAASSGTSWAFNDITTGNNIVTCSGGTGCNNGTLGYSAGVGYDQVTGLGSIDATALGNALAGAPNPHFWVLPISRSVSFAIGSSSTVAVNVTPKEGFTGSVNLTCSVSSSLAGASCSFDNPNVTVPGSANLTITGSAQATGTVTVQGTSGSNTDSVTINASIGVQDFQLTSGNSSETVNPGGSTTDTITVTSLLGFNGTVSFSCSGTTGLTCSLNPTSVTANPSGTVSSTLTVNASSSASSGAVTITATSGTLTHNRVIPVTVNAGFSLTASTSTLTIPRGMTGSATLTVTPAGGFNSNVVLTCNVSTSLGTTTCSVNPSTISGGSGTATLTIQAAVVGKDRGGPLPYGHRGFGAYATLVFALGMAFAAKGQRGLLKPAAGTKATFAGVDLSVLRRVLLGMLALGVMLGALSCGGGGNSGGGGSSPLTGTVTVSGTGGGVTNSIDISVTVQ